MSIPIKTCLACGQVNPAIHNFCPTCGAILRDAAVRNAPWTSVQHFPPMAAAVDPEKKRRRRHALPESRGVGLAWLGFVMVALPIAIPNTRPGFTTIGWVGGMLAIMAGYWQMRRDAHTLARAGLLTNALAVLTLSIIVFKIVSTDPDPGDLLPAIANPSTEATTAPDWAGAATPGDQPAQADVAMYRGNAAHTGELPGPGITGRPFRAWRFDATGELYSSPAVVDGLVYVGSKGGFLYALDATSGEERWRADLGNYIVRSSPAVTDERVFVGAGYSLFALDAANGRRAWQGKMTFSGSSSPTVAGGVVYVASQSSSVYAFDIATGEERWHFQTDGPIFSAPTVTEKFVLVGTDNGKVIALTIRSGQPKWKFEAEGGIFSSPAVANGLVYVTTKGRTTYAIELETGRVRWSYDVGGDASPAVVGGTVYVASEDGGIYALDAATGGQPKWLFPTGAAIRASPVVADGIVYVASGTTLYAVDAASGTERWRYAAGYPIETSPVVVNGYVYIGGRDGFLDAITGDGRT